MITHDNVGVLIEHFPVCALLLSFSSCADNLESFSCRLLCGLIVGIADKRERERERLEADARHNV
jgi:hypothetical protein